MGVLNTYGGENEKVKKKVVGIKKGSSWQKG